MDSNIIREICNYLCININDDITIDDLADIFHYNKFYLIKKFKEYTGFTINEYINECRVYNSTNPLMYTDDTILKIALNNGFKSQEYYSEKFKDIIGSAPLKFRNTFSKLFDLIEKTDDKEELNYLKATLEELNNYQDYLNSLGSSRNTKQDKPKIKVLSIPNKVA